MDLKKKRGILSHWEWQSQSFRVPVWDSHFQINPVEQCQHRTEKKTQLFFV